MSDKARSHAEFAERIALAILNGDADSYEAWEQPRPHTRAARFRAGEPVWAWPAQAPWA